MLVDLENYDEACGIWYRVFGDDLVLREVVVGAHREVTRAQMTVALGENATGVVARKARLAFRTYEWSRSKGRTCGGRRRTG